MRSCGDGRLTVVRASADTARAIGKRIAEVVLWSRVKLGHRFGPKPRLAPSHVPATDILRTESEWRAAVAECRKLGLPLHYDRPKNWDALGAVSVLLERFGNKAAVLDAGSARYSPVLPWLRLYGFSDLVGINLEFGRPVRWDGVLFQHGDIAATGFPDSRFDAVMCMSVIEHGVPIRAFLAECARILRPGGLLILSTDYSQHPVDVAGRIAYGNPVHIFAPEEIQGLVRMANEHGLSLRGELRLEHHERPVHWKRMGLRYTFIRLAFDRR